MRPQKRKENSLAQELFYQHGVFCASYPFHILALTVIAILGLSWPVIVRAADFIKAESVIAHEPTLFWETATRGSTAQEAVFAERFGDTPHLRVEQLVLNASRTYQHNDASDGRLSSGMLERNALLNVLVLHQKISSAAIYLDQNGRILLDTDKSDSAKPDSTASSLVSLDDICYKPKNSTKCLAHSVFEFWDNDKHLIESDAHVLKTLSNSSAISSFGNSIPLRTVLKGFEFQDTRKNNDFHIQVTKAESIVITYFLEERRIEAILGQNFDLVNKNANHQELISSLWDALWQKAITKSDHSSARVSGYWIPSRAEGEVRNVYYVFGGMETEVSVEVVIVALSYIIVFLYISLVLGKVELVKSKFGLGLGAVIMVFSSLTMSVGLTSIMGVTSSLVPWEALPFLIIAVGVENIFVMTNAVVTTSLDLPIKERIGIGLSKVGVKMTRSLAGQLIILMVVSVIDVPALQEFCLFACVAVVIDFMMQITFFATILSIDIRRLELSDLHKLNATSSSQSMVTQQKKYGRIDASLGMLDSNPKRWSALVMIIIMIGIGFGLYKNASSAQPFQNHYSNIPQTQPWEETVSAVADVLWDVINPSNDDRYIEVRPPLYMTFSQDQVDALPIQPTFSPESSTFKKKSWTITVDAYSFQISRSVFIVAFVSLLILVSLGCILISSMILHLVKGSSLRPDSQPLFQEREKKFGNYRTISLTGSTTTDVDYIDAADDGTVAWACGEGFIHFWNCRTTRRIAGLETHQSTAARCITCFRIAGMNLYAGTADGNVKSWDTYSGKMTSSSNTVPSKASIHSIHSINSPSEPTSLVVSRFDGTIELWPPLSDAPESGNSICVLHKPQPAPSIESTILCCTVDPPSKLILAATGNSGTVVSITTTPSQADVALRSSVNISAICVDQHLDVLVTGSELGDIVLQQYSSKRELLFIRSKSQVAAERDERTSFESDTSKASYTVNGKKVSRVASILEGHAGEITFLKIVQVQHPLPAEPTTHQEFSFFVVSAGVDEFVNVWQITVTKNRGLVAIMESSHVKSIHQSGCAVATSYEASIIGARRMSSVGSDARNGEDDASSRLRNRKAKRNLNQNKQGWWEFWILDLNLLSATENGGAEPTSILIGPDLLAGIPLGTAASQHQMRRTALQTRIAQHGRTMETVTNAVRHSLSRDNEWIDYDEEENQSERDVSNDEGEDEDPPQLPVFSIHSIVATRWGIVCGFANVVKIVFVDLGNGRLKSRNQSFASLPKPR
ncbi:sterol-sensing domain of SREBP cleavage-activation-domain-containing protein [Chytriomyces cf. hyalinus JEL632]|nr:sterol-sensing domain of SREBP cleavage-activation-domain-containing protein [Chytriomyces cf. hyalinus JEL632]